MDKMQKKFANFALIKHKKDLHNVGLTITCLITACEKLADKRGVNR